MAASIPAPPTAREVAEIIASRPVGTRFRIVAISDYDPPGVGDFLRLPDNNGNAMRLLEVGLHTGVGEIFRVEFEGVVQPTYLGARFHPKALASFMIERVRELDPVRTRVGSLDYISANGVQSHLGEVKTIRRVVDQNHPVDWNAITTSTDPGPPPVTLEQLAAALEVAARTMDGLGVSSSDASNHIKDFFKAGLGEPHPTPAPKTDKTESPAEIVAVRRVKL